MNERPWRFMVVLALILGLGALLLPIVTAPAEEPIARTTTTYNVTDGTSFLTVAGTVYTVTNGQVSLNDANLALYQNLIDNGTLVVSTAAGSGIFWNNELVRVASGATLDVQSGAVFTADTSITGDPVFSGTVSLASTGLFDLNGVADGLVLDADADTTISAPTDDQIDIEINSADDFQFTANTFTAISGSTIKANTIAETTSAAGVTVDGLTLKDGGIQDTAGFPIVGVADAIQLTVTGYTTQTAVLQTWEASGGADVATMSAAGALDVASTINYGTGNLYPLGYASASYEIECGTTAVFTGSTTVTASALTTVTVPIAIQVTAPITTAAFLHASDPTTTTVTLTSLNNTFGAGTTGVQAHYCLVGNQ